jgi:hypothetical protein
MALTQEIPINQYIGNNLTVTFACNFTIFNADQVGVYLNGSQKTLTTDYTVIDVGINPFSVIFTTAPGIDVAITLQRQMLYERDYDYQEGGDLLATTLDNDFDQMQAQLQQLALIVDPNFSLSSGRGIVAPTGESGGVISTNEWTNRANHFVAYNGDGILSLLPMTISTTSIQTYIKISDYASLNAAINAIGGTTCTLILDVPTTYTGLSPLPSNIFLQGSPGGIITIAVNQTLVINGLIANNNLQYFDCSASGSGVTFSSNVKEVYPEWFGVNTTPGTTDMTVAINKAAASLANGSCLIFTGLAYNVTSKITVPAGANIIGRNYNYTVIQFNPIANNQPLFETAGDFNTFENITLALTNTGNKTGSIGITIRPGASLSSNIFVEKCTFTGEWSIGFYSDNLLLYSHISNSQFIFGNFIGTGIKYTGNNVSIKRSRFANQKYPIDVEGVVFSITDNAFEVNGSVSNTSVVKINCDLVSFSDNYLEENITAAGGHEVDFVGSTNVRVISNIFNSPGVANSLHFAASSVAGLPPVIVECNRFLQKTTGIFSKFIVSDGPSYGPVVIARSNQFFNETTGIMYNNYADIMAMVSSQWVEVDIPIRATWSPGIVANGATVSTIITAVGCVPDVSSDYVIGTLSGIADENHMVSFKPFGPYGGLVAITLQNNTGSSKTWTNLPVLIYVKKGRR